MTKRKLKTKRFRRQDTRMRKDYKPNIINWKGEGRWNNILVSKARGYPGDCWRILNKKISALSARERAERPMSIWMSSTQYKTFRLHADSLRQGLLDRTFTYMELFSQQIRFSFVSVVTDGKWKTERWNHLAFVMNAIKGWFLVWPPDNASTDNVIIFQKWSRFECYVSQLHNCWYMYLYKICMYVLLRFSCFWLRQELKEC